MICKIIMDEKCRNKLQVTVTVAEPSSEGVCISLHIADKSADTVDLQAAPFLDLNALQANLIALIKVLIKQNYATYAGHYSRHSKKIPLFRGDNQTGLYVNSIDKKTGQRLLKGKLMTNPDTIRKLARWIVLKFPIVSQWAGLPMQVEENDEIVFTIITQAAQQLEVASPKVFAHERNLIHLNKIPDDRLAI